MNSKFRSKLKKTAPLLLSPSKGCPYLYGAQYPRFQGP